MNQYISYLAALFMMLGLLGCDHSNSLHPITESCSFSIPLSNHPKSKEFQNILSTHRSNSLVGGIGLVKNDSGIWIGSDGWADMENQVPIESCHRFLIASISKMFTAAAIMIQYEAGVINLDAPMSYYLDLSWADRVPNIHTATVRQVLNHTSGIPDFYDHPTFDLRRFDKADNQFSPQEILEFTFSLKPYFEPGNDYEYSNSNYLILGLALEEVLQMSLGEVYRTYIFEPLGIESGYFDVENPIPTGTVKGYAEPFPGEIIGSDWLYKDELGTGDGGIAIHIYDLYLFLEGLFRPQLFSMSTLETMLAPIQLNDDDSETILGHQRNGLGIEIYETPKGGLGLGHTGGIDGYSSYAMYFPENQSFVIYFQNLASFEIEDRLSIINGLTEVLMKG